MSVVWQNIPGCGIFKDAKQTKRDLDIVLNRLTKALGKDLVQNLVSKELLILLPSFDGYSALSAAAGKGVLPMERTCIYVRPHNTVYVNLDHCNNPALISHVVSALGFDTVVPEDKRLNVYQQACTKLLKGNQCSPFVARALYEKSTRIKIRSILDRTPELKAFFEDYWLKNHEGLKPIPPVALLEEKKHDSMLLDSSSTINDDDIAKYLFSNVYAFAKTVSNSRMSSFDITVAPKGHFRVSSIVRSTTVRIPNVEALFGAKFDTQMLDVSATHPYPADLGMVSENANPHCTWRLDTEMSALDWEVFFANRTQDSVKCDHSRSIFATGIVMAGKPHQKESVDLIVTHQVDMVNMENHTLHYLPFISQEAKPITAQICGCVIPETLDWAMLSLQGAKYKFNFTALNTSWLAQCDKLNAFTDYSINLAFWAMSADESVDSIDLCPFKEPDASSDIDQYRISGKITRVVGKSNIQNLNFTIFNFKSCANRKAFPEITVALRSDKFDALSLKKGKNIRLTGIFLITGINSIKHYSVDLPEVTMKIPGLSPLALRRRLNLSLYHGDMSPEAAALYLGSRVSDMALRRQSHSTYLKVLLSAAAYGHFDSLKDVSHLYQQAQIRREQMKSYDMTLVYACEEKIRDHFLNLCQLGLQTPLEFLTFEGGAWLPVADDIRSRLIEHLALTHNSGMAYAAMAQNFRAERTFDQMKDAELIRYRGYLAHAVFECEYWPAAKSLTELYLSGRFSFTSLEETFELLLNIEKKYLPARSWFSCIVLMQNSFFTATNDEIFETFKNEVQYGSPLYTHDFAWFLLATASNELSTPKTWALLGASLLQWLSKFYNCPAYFDNSEVAFSILARLGVIHRLKNFDPWKYLNIDEPTGTIPLLKSVRPLGFPGFMHQVFLESLANISEGDKANQVQARMAHIFQFLAENAVEIRESSNTANAGDEQPRRARILSYGSKKGYECLITETPNDDGSWRGQSICPVFKEGLELNVKLIGGITDLGLCTGVMSATSNGLDLLHCFNPYWMLQATKLSVGELCRIAYYGLGQIQLFNTCNPIISPKQGHIECLNERTAQYVATASVKSVKPNMVEIAGVSFAKVVLSLRDFIYETNESSLPIYVPMNYFNSELIKPRTEVIAVFELHGRIKTDNSLFESVGESHTIN